MKPSSILKSVAIVATSTLVTISAAQAGSCMPGMFNVPTPCANQQPGQPACPRQENPQSSSCPTGNAELASMAAGGLQIAGNVMRVLAEQAGKVLAVAPGM